MQDPNDEVEDDEGFDDAPVSEAADLTLHGVQDVSADSMTLGS